MSTPLANKTTISSRNKMTQLNGAGEEVLTQTSGKTRLPTSQIARNRALRPPTSSTATVNGTSVASSRIASLANGIPSQLKAGGRTSAIAKPSSNYIAKTPSATSRLVPHTTNRIPPKTATHAPPLNSRSSSILSSISSATTSKNIPVPKPSLTNHIPTTTTVRKGLAKFSNPIECQRQFQALSLKVKQLNEDLEAREKQLKRSIDMGVGYAATVQYFAVKLKLDSEVNLLEESEQLRRRVEELTIIETQFNDKLEVVHNDYKNQLKVQDDLRNNLEKELEETRIAHSEILKDIEDAHQRELIDLKETHSNIECELTNKVRTLSSELDARQKELTELRTEHEYLTNSYNKLEESLTKDKDARVKYAQEKISQLQKDVESLNSVLDMRTEKIHELEKEKILLVEVQNELMSTKDLNRSLQQQLESVNAALDKKREQFENLMVEHEKVSQELKRERKERRRMTMRTEQLEFVLNESCVADTPMKLNSSLRNIDSADHLV